jgi:DNA-binding transcriptional LysR family regulator
MATPRWDWLETFLSAAEERSFTGAAKALGMSQPTVSRQVQQLEQSLGATLFVRHARGLALTDRGTELLDAAKDLDEHVRQVLIRAAGLRQHPEGVVRISASEPMGVQVLAPCYAELCVRYPRIRLELLIENRMSNLSRREADIAVRMQRPAQADLIARRVGELPVGIYGHQAYLKEHGTPSSVDELTTHRLIGFDQQRYWLKQIGSLGLKPSDFCFRTDNVLAQQEAIVHRVGLGVMQQRMAANHPELHMVLPEIHLEPVPLWLVAHQELRSSVAVRAVFDALIDRLHAWCYDTPPPSKDAIARRRASQAR